MAYLIPCQNCRKEYLPTWSWFVCDKCNFRICVSCLSTHSGKYSNGGYKCSQCTFGQKKGPKQLN